jgi:hypothetical protein
MCTLVVLNRVTNYCSVGRHQLYMSIHFGTLEQQQFSAVSMCMLHCSADSSA